MLDAKIKILKKEGKENITHKPAIAPEDLTKLKTSSVVLPSTPLGLMRNVWFHTTLYWCRRGRQGQHSLTPQSFIFDKDARGKAYVTMAHDESTSFLSVCEKKLASKWQRLVRKSPTRRQQARQHDARDQSRSPTFTYLDQPFSASNCNNTVLFH